MRLLVYKSNAFKDDFRSVLVGSREKDRKWIRALEAGIELWVKPWIIRSPRAHRSFFAMLSGVLHNLPEDMPYTTVDELRGALLMEAGYSERITNFDGEVIQVPRSMSWGKMDQAEFDEVFKSITKILIGPYFWPSMSLKEVSEFISVGIDDKYDPDRR